RSRRNPAVPAPSFTFLFGSGGGGARSAATVVPGFSAAHANHFTWTLSTHSSVHPFSSPSTQRPATSHRDFVSVSRNRPEAGAGAGSRVTVRGGTTWAPGGTGTPSSGFDARELSGWGALNFRGCDATGR